MAVEERKAPEFVRWDRDKGDSALGGSEERLFVGVVDAVAGDSTGSVYRFLRVPANLVPTEIVASTTGLGAGCAASVGVYRPLGADNGTVIDVDEFDSELFLESPGSNYANNMAASPAVDFSKIGKQLWERLGFARNPGHAMDICLTLTAPVVTTGQVCIGIRGTLK